MRSGRVLASTGVLHAGGPTVWVALAACVVALGPAGMRWLRVAQREHYLGGSVPRFAFRWWTVGGVNMALGAAGLAGLAASVWWPLAAVATAAAVAGGPLGLSVPRPDLAARLDQTAALVGGPLGAPPSPDRGSRSDRWAAGRRGRGWGPGRAPGPRPGVSNHGPGRAAPRPALRPVSRQTAPGGSSDGGRHHRLLRQDVDEAPCRRSGRRDPDGGGHAGVVQQPGGAGPSDQRAPGRGDRGLCRRDGRLRAGRDRRDVQVVPPRHRGDHGHRPRPPRADGHGGADPRGQSGDHRVGSGRGAQCR